MLTVHNFIARPPQLTKQGKEPRSRLAQTNMLLAKAETVWLVRRVGVREAIIKGTTDLGTPLSQITC